MAAPKIKSDERTITVRVPISIKRRGGRKVVLMPDGAPIDSRKLVCQSVDSAIVKAIARAFRWREMLENGRHGTIQEIAHDEGINESYVARVLRLTLLAPNIVEAILRGNHSPAITLATLMKPFPTIWVEQTSKFRRHTFQLSWGN
jgi:hypothetical protein